MKAKSLICFALITMMLFINTECEARRSSGGSSRSSYSGGYSGYSGRSSTTTSTVYRSNGSSFSGYAVSGYYRPFGSYVLVIGSPYYDPHYLYYYNCSITYRQSQPASVLDVLIVIIVIMFFLAIFAISNKNREGGWGDDDYTETRTTTVYE